MDIFYFLIIVFFILWLQSYLLIKNAFKNLHYKCYFSVVKSREGDHLEFIEEVYNNKFLPIPWLKINICTSKWLEFADGHSTIAQDSRYITSGYFLKGYQKTLRKWKVKTLKRGFFETKIVTLVAGDLFGIQSTSKGFPTNATLLVLPLPISSELILLSQNTIMGNSIVRRWILEDPFFTSGARPYESSDSMKKIHWTATAKEQKLMVRKNDFSSSPSLALILNIQSLDNENDIVIHKDIIEYGIKIAAGIIEKSFHTSTPISFSTNSYINSNIEPIKIEKSIGSEHIYEILETLAKLKLSNSKEFSVLLREVLVNIQNEDVFIISSYISKSFLEPLYQLIKQNNRVNIIYINNFRINITLPQGVNIIYG